MSTIVHPCRVGGRFMPDSELVVDLVELIPAGSTNGIPDFVEGHHDFAHTQCLRPGSRVQGWREVARGQSVDARLRALGDRSYRNDPPR